MMQDFVQIICEMAIFIICSKLLLNLKMREGYEKYIKLIVGAMLLLQLLSPFFGEKEFEQEAIDFSYYGESNFFDNTEKIDEILEEITSLEVERERKERDAQEERGEQEERDAREERDAQRRQEIEAECKEETCEGNTQKANH